MAASADLRLNSIHCRSICDEIEGRVRIEFAPRTTAIPLRLRRLIDLLADQERDTFPSNCAACISTTRELVRRLAAQRSRRGAKLRRCDAKPHPPELIGCTGTFRRNAESDMGRS
jgi:hypothetical protein